MAPASVYAFPRLSHRCARSFQCAERVHDENQLWLGAPIETETGLCTICTLRVEQALVALPMDVAELTVLMGQSIAQPPTDREMVSSSSELGIPIRADLEALRALIDHELYSWADATAEAMGTGHPGVMVRMSARVAACAGFLRGALPTFLALGDTRHLARSTGEDPTEGHDPDTTTRYRDDWYTVRDGLTGALTLLGLHAGAYRLAARSARPDRSPMPCPKCQMQGLLRWHGRRHRQCEHCGNRVLEDDYDVLAAAVAVSVPAAAE